MTDRDDYISVEQAAENWDISEDLVCFYCVKGYIPGAVKGGRRYLVPKDAEKPLKYRFVLVLPYDIEMDSAAVIEGYTFYPKASQSDPIVLRGIFDSYDEAKAYAATMKVYKYILPYESYDSFEDEIVSDYPQCFLLAEEAAEAAIGAIDPRDVPPCHRRHPDRYTIEKTEVPKEGGKRHAYKYVYWLGGRRVYDSTEDEEYFFDADIAKEVAESNREYFDIAVTGELYEIKEVEIVDIRIEEI